MSPTSEITASSHDPEVAPLNPSQRIAPTQTLPEEAEIHDLICIGFGPASLAIAIALQERNESHPGLPKPRVSFLERQARFGWHSGMQLPGAKMQISFLKDLATPRNPRSRFTFLNYLFRCGRLGQFINLDTFLPTRLEYEDYLRWCAAFFEAQGVVAYAQDVLSVAPAGTSPGGKVDLFRVLSVDAHSGVTTSRLARHVVVAAGGRLVLPAAFPQSHPAVVHSSAYSTRVSAALPDPTRSYRVAVVGSGQSAAEIFNDLPSRYPAATVTLVIRGAALRPSDDSPFVNEVFDPERVDGVYALDEGMRALSIARDRGTNYSVVRIGLLEQLYERLYMQRVQHPDTTDWKIRIKPRRQVVQTEVEPNGSLLLKLQSVLENGILGPAVEELPVDAVFAATGYVRDAHEEILLDTQHLLRNYPDCCQDRLRFPVRRDYKVDFDEDKVCGNAGIWLQGCNEETHGLSDSLLSILAVRGGELVESIFSGEGEVGVRSKL